MIQISVSGYYNQQNYFKIKEIYFSNESTLYVLKSEESFFPSVYEGTVKELYDSVKNCYYPNFEMSEPRIYKNDNDAKSLATFFMNKIKEFDLSKPGSERRLYDIINGFGEEIT